MCLNDTKIGKQREKFCGPVKRANHDDLMDHDVATGPPFTRAIFARMCLSMTEIQSWITPLKKHIVSIATKQPVIEVKMVISLLNKRGNPP